MPSFIHKVRAEEIAGLNGIITGTAHYDVRTDSGMNADIGGWDGAFVSHCEFLGIYIDGICFATRQAVLDLIGPDKVAALEDVAAEEVLMSEAA